MNIMGSLTVVPISQEMTQKSIPPLSFLGRRSYAPRPLSEATLIFDTDVEDDDDNLSTPRSNNDTQSTVSTQDELQTPLTAGLGGFDFHFDPNPTSGPVGPHLFRSPAEPRIADEDVFVCMSPIGFPKQANTPRPFSATPTPVNRLDESQVRSWSPKQVAHWMTEAGFEQAVTEKFLVHDIYGSILVDLQLDDLKEIEINSFGKRHQVMTAVQHLRKSSSVSVKDLSVLEESPIDVTPTTLCRSINAEEKNIYTARSTSRRGRKPRKDDITPMESVSIVAIEQLLPEPHSCAKGENCKKWLRQQQKIERIKARFEAETQGFEAKSTIGASVIGPSIVGSSDVLGPSALPISAIPITAQALSELQLRDPKENVRQFLDFQHMHSPREETFDEALPSPTMTVTAKSTNLNQHLRGLPRLAIPSQIHDDDAPSKTPLATINNPAFGASEARAALLNDPYHYGGVASPVDVYRVGTPMSATDIPITAFAIDPCERGASQSVPPEMKYGASASSFLEPPHRSITASPATQARRRPSFMPTIAPVSEHDDLATARPIHYSEASLANHAGWMRKRKTARLIKHEWQDQYFNLEGSKLDMYANENITGDSLESLDIDEYALHAYSMASSSKLHAAFKKSVGSSTAQPSFAFSLIPEDQKPKKIFQKSAQSHHFAVNHGRDRVEWMRKLMLAKAMKKNDTSYQI